VRDPEAEDYTEHHADGFLEYRFTPRRGIPFPAFTEISAQFPELSVEASWQRDGKRGRARIENGRLVEQTAGDDGGAPSDLQIHAGPFERPPAAIQGLNTVDEGLPSGAVQLTNPGGRFSRPARTASSWSAAPIRAVCSTLSARSRSWSVASKAEFNRRLAARIALGLRPAIPAA